MQPKFITRNAVPGVLIPALCLASNLSYADPVEFLETRQEADGIATRLERQIAFEGSAQGGNIEYVLRAGVVLFENVFQVQLDTVFLLKVEDDASGHLEISSACGEGNSFGMDWLDSVYVVDKRGVAVNVHNGSEETYLSKEILREAENCYRKLYANHAAKNIAEIKIRNASDQTITLSWFAGELHDYFSNSDSQFNVWEASKVTVKETEASEAPVTVEVQRISEMACDDGGPPRIIEDWKRGATPWTPLVELEKGVFQDENATPSIFPDYDKSELDKLVTERIGWNPQYVSCNPMELGPTYRFKRQGKILYEAHIPVVW